MHMPQTKAGKPVECSEYMMYMTLSAVRDYLGLALSAKDVPAVNRCEVSLGFVRDALELVKKLEECFGHGR